MKQACFLDRDGVINVEKYYLHEPELLELIPRSGEALSLLQKAGFLLIAVTNQAGVAKGKFPAEDVEQVHARLAELLQEFGVKLDAVYCCMHHPDFTGPCDCRKPAPGMLLEAARHFDIDLAHSYMVGDRMSDLLAGVHAGVSSILVRTGYGAETEKSGEAAAFPVYDDLFSAVKDGILKRR